ncbi:hypothetical protein KD050_15835 [Psychrobacillus sp. INOP01]|uniref:hypothetical protein n=1 Tax=Psychrobacillus sp. INOP01 TaxID=2829187 RepID=UPI001BAC4942|nr:hypothetical protein [Psychrobacillus sp. INOP01]QUG40751.1 hypothetical protein KD050_15835 [Psychrobacillus sp. INOP01]
MRYTKMNKFAFVCLATFGTIVIVFIVNTVDANHISITENNVRSQLEQMYDAEVAEVKKNEDVYEAIIAKSGEVYLVEMNAATGDVKSLEHTDEFIIEEVPFVSKEITNEVADNSPTKTPSPEDKVKSNNGASKLVVTEKPKESSEKVKVVEKPKDTENKTKKDATSKKEEKAEEKPIKKVIKDAIKDVLKKEENKTETAIKDKKKVDEVKKEEIAKAEVSKAANESAPINVEPEKLESLTVEPTKADTPKAEAAEVPKSEESQSSKESISIKAEEKSEDLEKNATVLITAEEAIKLALAYQKGVMESNTFIRTNEGGYYLVVMGIESSKEKKSKATVQVHAISGKVLSITLE